jgi:hypothetical protein
VRGVRPGTYLALEQAQWTNWAGSLTTLPDLFFQPKSVREVQDLDAAVRLERGNSHRSERSYDNGQKAFRWQKNGQSPFTR